jgi:VWFA-related protein
VGLGHLSAQRAVVRSRVEGVRIDVSVVNRAGEPVHGLTAADFRLAEDGHVQRILQFEEVSIPLQSRSVDLNEKRSPSTDVVTNSGHTGAGRAVVIVVDVGAHNLVQSRQIMMRLLQGLSDEDEVAIVFVRRSDLSQDFTQDLGRLMAAVNNMKSAIGPKELRATRFVLSNAIKTLSSVAQARRAIIYVGEGFTVQFIPDTRDERGILNGSTLSRRRSIASDLITLLESAKRAGVPIHTIDPSGSLDSSPATEFLKTVAVATGGEAVVTQPYIDRGVDRILQKSGNYYVLGYTPEPDARDGRFHQIKLTVEQPGAQVQARFGYLAQTSVPKERQTDAIVHAVEHAQAQSNLELRVFAAPVAGASGRMELASVVDVLYPESARDQILSGDTVKVFVVAVDPDGKVYESIQRTFAFSSLPVGRRVVSFDDRWDLPSRKLMLRVAVESTALDRVGAVHLPIEPLVVTRDQHPAISPLVVGLLASEHAVIANAATIAPLIPFQPTTLRSFGSNDSLTVFARAYGVKPGNTMCTVFLRQGARMLLQQALGRRPVSRIPDAIDCEGTVRLADTIAGSSYTLEISVGEGSTNVSTVPVAFTIR